MPKNTPNLLDSMLEAIPEFSIHILDVKKLLREKRSFRTPQIWGLAVSPNLYLSGSSATATDSGEPSVSAAYTFGSWVALSPLANMAFYEECAR